MTCDLEGSSKISYKTEFSPGRQGEVAKESIPSMQGTQCLSVDFRFIKCFEGSPGEMVKEENISENCIPDVNSRCGEEDIIEIEENGKQAQKPIHQTSPSSNTGWKKRKDQTLKLCEPNGDFLCQKIATKNVKHEYSQIFFC